MCIGSIIQKESTKSILDFHQTKLTPASWPVLPQAGPLFISSFFLATLFSWKRSTPFSVITNRLTLQTSKTWKSGKHNTALPQSVKINNQIIYNIQYVISANIAWIHCAK